jgi:hypothetical protein
MYFRGLIFLKQGRDWTNHSVGGSIARSPQLSVGKNPRDCPGKSEVGAEVYEAEVYRAEVLVLDLPCEASGLKSVELERDPTGS